MEYQYSMEKLQSTEASKENLSIEEIRRRTIESLSEFESEAFYIDEGGAGKVYELTGDTCMKVLIDRHNSPNREMYDLGNTAYEEIRLQTQMSRTSYEGTARVPNTVYVLQGTYTDRRSAIIMERLNAVNLQHAINGIVEFPENFDIESFMEELENFIDHMHSTEKIAHMDLYARNIMIDIETGHPRVIDFGRAVRLSENDQENSKYEDDDWQRLEEIYNTVKSLQNK